MKKILVKAAMPIAPFNPNELNDLSALRVLPTNRMNTYSNPIPLTEENVDFERRVLETGGEALPGFDETDNFGRRLAGTWSALPAYRWFAEPDLGNNIGNRPLELVGILNQQPEWSAGRKQGRLENEGFHYGGVDPSNYRNMQLPEGTDMEGLMYGARGAMLERGEDLHDQGFRRWIAPRRIERQMKDSKRHRAIRDALLALDIPAVGSLAMWKKPTIRDEYDFRGKVWEKPPFSSPIETGEPMDLAWRLLKAQQTLDAYHRENIREGFEPDVQNVIIASKPGAEDISAEEQSRLHDKMLRRISELEGAEGIRIISARGRSEEWGDENSFMLTNVPDDMMPEIHSLAGEFGQDSILHSPKGKAGTQFVDSEGKSDGGLEEGGFTRKEPENYTEFPTGQKYAYGDYVAASEPMDLSWRLLKEDDIRRNISEYAQNKDWGTVDEIVDHIFDMGYPKTPFLSMNNNQLKLLNQMIFNHGTDGKPTSPSYWREPFQEADYGYESEIMMGEGMEHIPDEVYDEIIRYHQHYNDAVDELPGGADPSTQEERQLHFDLMGQGADIPESHPHNVATQRMQNEYPHWGEDDVDFGSRYGLVHSERQFTPDFDDTSWQDSLERAKPMPIGDVLVKSNLVLYPPEKNYLGQFGNVRPPGVMMGGTSYTLLPNQTANVTNPFTSTPPLNPTEKEQMDLQHGVMETDVHEDMHRAMHSIGEMYDNPVHNEFPAVLAGALQFTRRPKEIIHPKDKMIPELESGKDPRLIAIEHAKKFAPKHTQASGHIGPHGIHRIGLDEKPRSTYEKKSEPMPIGDVLVKDRVSPEAKRHKLEYDTAYEASPERRKYRADLNRERRRRGMYGDHSGRDISHTEGGKLTVEGAHENRARHFKNQGTLRHVGVKKKANDERKANLVNVVPPQKGDDEPIIS